MRSRSDSCGSAARVVRAVTDTARAAWFGPGLVVTSLAGGCAFDDGRPWGAAALTLEVALEAPASRLDDAGRLKTANDFRIRLDAVELTVAEVALSGAGEAASAFDPANPPPGYGTCHNGHCHAADGRLVSYEDIAAELGATSGGELTHAEGGLVTVALGESRDVPLTCVEGCTIAEPGTVTATSVIVSAWTVRGTAFDARTGELARLAPEGEAFVLTGAAPLTWSAVMSAAVGPGRDYGVRVGATLAFPVDVFDAIEWGDVTPDAARDEVAAALGEATPLTLTVRRFD